MGKNEIDVINSVRSSNKKEEKMMWEVSPKAIGQVCHFKNSRTNWAGRRFLMDKRSDGTHYLDVIHLSTPQKRDFINT